jgi:hypothetical protein
MTLSIAALYNYAKFHFAQCCVLCILSCYTRSGYAECRYAVCRGAISLSLA